MVTDELLAYIQLQLNKNTPLDLISARLLQAGWLKSDVDEALQKSTIQKPVAVSKPLDPYRELPTEDLKNGEVVKISPPVMVTPKIEPVVFSNTPVQAPKIIEEANTETPTIQEKPIVKAEEPIQKPSIPILQAIAPMQEKKAAPISEPKVWVPMQQKIVEAQPLEIAQAYITPKDEPKIEEVPIDLSKMVSTSFTVVDEPKVESKPVEQKPAVASIPMMGPIVSQVVTSTLSPVMPENMKQEVKELPKIEVAQVAPVVLPDNREMPITAAPIEAPKEIPIADIKPVEKSTLPVSTMSPLSTQDMLSRNAMLSTYASGMNASKESEPNVLVSHTGSFKKLAVILVVLFALFGTAYGFMAGFISVPSFLQFSFVKKDPKQLLVNNASLLASHSSYKSDTTIVLSTPAVANITSGLMSGTQVTSKDTDTVSLSFLTKVGTNNSTRIYDTDIHLASSLLKNDIISNIIYDTKNAYLAVPQLTEILGDTAPAPSVVMLPEGHFGMISSELPANMQDVIKRIDVYDVASKGIPPFVKSEVVDSFGEFMKTAAVVQKGNEDIRGSSTYHYTVTPDRQMTKKFLSDIFGIFITTLSPDIEQKVDEALGSVRFDDFDIWVGKSDGIVHQYKITLIAPLSKVIALDDKGIAGNVVKFSVTTTFYDFDIQNNIAIPENAVAAEDFGKTMHDAKIKSVMNIFSENAKILSHADGGYGMVANTVGSCVSPKAGSLFSPLGHKSGGASAVGLISSNMNDILNLSGQTGSCYSSLSAWALAVPRTTDPSTSYCIDSVGSSTVLTSPLSGNVCK
jgi:hypothetical protein